MPDETKDTKLTRKEFFKQLRRDAYQKAKERRKTDPKQIALNLEMKTRRREAYQEMKARRKVAQAELKQVQREKTERMTEKHAKIDAELLGLVTRGTELE